MPGDVDESKGLGSRVRDPLHIINQMRPVTKRDNSCMLKAPDLARLEFEI